MSKATQCFQKTQDQNSDLLTSRAMLYPFSSWKAETLTLNSPTHMVFFFLKFDMYICCSYHRHLFIYLWLCWVFVSGRGLSPVATSGGHSSSRCAGLFTIAASLVA